MTEALERAFQAASKLPDDAQDELAAAILDELELAAAFDQRLAGTASLLKRLADEALVEHRARLTMTLDPDDL